MLRSHRNDALVALVAALGQDNVFITIHESGSWDNSKGALRDLDTGLALLCRTLLILIRSL
jgi:hypothetical protein